MTCSSLWDATHKCSQNLSLKLSNYFKRGKTVLVSGQLCPQMAAHVVSKGQSWLRACFLFMGQESCLPPQQKLPGLFCVSSPQDNILTGKASYPGRPCRSAFFSLHTLWHPKVLLTAHDSVPTFPEPGRTRKLHSMHSCILISVHFAMHRAQLMCMQMDCR